MAEEQIPLTVQFELLGRETTSLESWSIDSSYMTSTDGFEFGYIDTEANTTGLEGQPVILTLGDAQQLKGRIDETTTGDRGLLVSCAGRDYLADMVECNIDPLVTVNEGMTLQAAIQAAVAPVGIQIVLGDADIMRKARSGISPKTRGSKKSFLALTANELKPEPEQGIYDWCNRLAARYGCTIQPSLNRNEILLQAPNYDQDPIAVLRRSRTAGGSNRIKTASAKRSFTRFPTYTIARGANVSADTEKVGANLFKVQSSDIAAQTQHIAVQGRVKPSSTADADGKLYRLLSLHDRLARTKEQVTAAAFRAIWDRLKDTLVYTATLKGHRDPDTGAIYSVDTIVDVQDDVARVNERMWIFHRKLSYDPKNGAETMIECWSIGAYQTGPS